MIIEGSLDTFDRITFEELIKRKFSKTENIEFLYISASVLVNITLVYDDFQIAKEVSSQLQITDLSSIQEDWFNSTFVITSFSSGSVETLDESSSNRLLVWQIGIVVVTFSLVYLCLRFCEKKKQRGVIVNVNTNKKIETRAITVRTRD